MGKRDMGKRDTDKGESGLEDDAELWARIARTAAPLKKKNRVTHVATPPKPPRPKQIAAALAGRGQANAQARAEAGRPPALSPA